jgi:hypothetical protein
VDYFPSALLQFMNGNCMEGILWLELNHLHYMKESFETQLQSMHQIIDYTNHSNAKTLHNRAIATSRPILNTPAPDLC